MKTTWVVVADEGVAHILRRSDDAGSAADLEPVDTLTDAAAHADEAALRRDAVGRRSGSAGAGALRGTSSVTSSAGESEKHQEAELFARRLAQRLLEDLRQHRYDELRIAAAPRFLGLLRRSIDPQVAATVKLELDKDLTHLGRRELTAQLMGSPA